MYHNLDFLPVSLEQLQVCYLLRNAGDCTLVTKTQVIEGEPEWIDLSGVT